MTNQAMSAPSATALRVTLADGEKEANVVARFLT
jgi:hypothetical protein